VSQTYNIYCDESCHLEHDGQPLMVLGALWCPLEKTREIADRIREIKLAHGLSERFEIKWTKVSPGNLDFYADLLNYFFDDDDLHFRALVAHRKDDLVHDSFNQNHDTWYYKMYFDTLKVLLRPDSCYRIYLDVKDTDSAEKVRRLHRVLSNNMYDFRREIIERIQTVRSDEVEQLQLADLLIGIISYASRGIDTSPAKLALVQRMRERSGYKLTQSTLLSEQKVNLFHWQPRAVAA
jgi:hypothetical protein